MRYIINIINYTFSVPYADLLYFLIFSNLKPAFATKPVTKMIENNVSVLVIDNGSGTIRPASQATMHHELSFHLLSVNKNFR